MIILSQNVYWFQGYPADDAQNIQVKPIVYEKLIDLYKSISPDILLLQEIQSLAVAQKTAEDLNMSYFYTAGEELHRYGGLTLYKKNINLQLKKLSFSIQFQRLFQMLELNHAGQEINIANVHLPSNAQLSKEKAKNKRLEEMAAIIKSTQNPDILCGDFNENEHQETPTINYLSQQNYFDAISHNIQPNRATKIKNARGDYIYIKNEKKTILKSFYTIDLEEYKLKNMDPFHLSDHFPVCIELN